MFVYFCQLARKKWSKSTHKVFPHSNLTSCCAMTGRLHGFYRAITQQHAHNRSTATHTQITKLQFNISPISLKFHNKINRIVYTFWGALKGLSKKKPIILSFDIVNYIDLCNRFSVIIILWVLRFSILRTENGRVRDSLKRFFVRT